jgi:hypothetical protein
MTRTASAAAGEPGHDACIAAHAGTVVGLGIGEGLAEGEGDKLGVGTAEGVGVGLASGDAEGLGCATRGPFAVQAPTASSTPKTANPLLTRGWNAAAAMDVTRFPGPCTEVRISMSFPLRV